MRIGLITPEPGHPLLADATALLAPEHTVEALDPFTQGKCRCRSPRCTC